MFSVKTGVLPQRGGCLEQSREVELVLHLLLKVSWHWLKCVVSPAESSLHVHFLSDEGVGARDHMRKGYSNLFPGSVSERHQSFLECLHIILKALV